MGSKKKTEKEKILAKLADNTLIAVDGNSYYGRVTKKDGVTTVTEAVECESTLDATVRKWIKENNLENLQTLNISGTATFVERPLTENQKDEIEIVALQAARAAVTAIPELINSKF